ncbi:glycine N-acyltransferase-like protein Keg1 [Glandiceps talaboti]
MDISQDPQALELLLNHLEDRLPESLPMYNLVRHVRDRKLDRTQIFVDDRNIRNCTTVLCMALNVWAEVNDIGWYIYSENADRLVSMFKQVKLTERCLDGFSQHDTVSFLCLDGKFLETINQYMDTHGYQIDKQYNELFRLYVRHLNKDAIASMAQKIPALPQGFTMAPLRLEHANLVTSKAIYSSPSRLPFLRKMIEIFPSVAIYPPNQDEPVSWSLLMQHGEPGFGYTDTKYRNMKFAQIRQAEMMSRLLDYGYKAVCTSTQDDNTAMKEVFKKYPGVKPLHLIHYIMFKKSPNKSTTSKL